MADTAWTAADFGGDTDLFSKIQRILVCVVESDRATQENLGRLLAEHQQESYRRSIMGLTYDNTYDRAMNAILECSESSDTFPSPEEWKRWDAAAQAIREFEQD